MKKLNKTIKDRLEQLRVPADEDQALLPQLMLTIFNEETPDNLVIGIYDRQEMEDEIFSLLRYSNKAVEIMLELEDQEVQEDLARRIEEAPTEEELREVLIMDLLYEVMSRNLDHFPNKYHLKISPVERNLGESYL
jgi:hypothetical protein